MSTTPTASPTERRSPSFAAAGLIVFAAVMMIMGGILQAVQGLVALVNDDFYVLGEEYVFKFDVTTWGWIHLLLGVVVTLAGFALFTGAVWARVVAVCVAVVGIVANFLWMPYYPLWSTILLVLDGFVIWAVTVHGRDVLEV